MNGIEKQAAFYRGYLPDDRSLVALTVLLSTTVTLWLLVYLMDVAGDALHAESSTYPGSAARVARAWNGKVFTDRPLRTCSPLEIAIDAGEFRQ